MSHPPPVLPYVQQRVCGRVVIDGSGDQMKITLRANWRLAIFLLLLALASAAGGWASFYFARLSDLWMLGMFLGYCAAIILFANAVGQAVKVQRVELSSKRLSVIGRGSSMAFLRAEIVSVMAEKARHSLGYNVPSVNVFFRNGATIAIPLANREQTRFAAEALRSEMGLDADPLHFAIFDEVSEHHVSVHVCASGAVADLRRSPIALEGPIIGLLAGAAVATFALLQSGPLAAVLIGPGSAVTAYWAWFAFVRWSPSVSGGVWDGEVVLYERRRMRRPAELRFVRDAVADVELAPSSKPGHSVLRIVFSSGEVVLSERPWPTKKLQALANTINTARRLCP